MDYPFLITDNASINAAYRMAAATLAGNILPFRDGILEREEPVILAGLGYDTPWTRDAAINVWNAGGLICPQISKNTLKSVLMPCPEGYRISGQYWDCIIWVIGAWSDYLYTGDLAFLRLAHNAATNTLRFFEETEFDEEWNLFRGAACYGDGVAAYPDVYAQHQRPGIIRVAEMNRHLCAPKGVGLPMFALSTNCLYYMAYVLVARMEEILAIFTENWAQKAKRMKSAINQHFWREEQNTYFYLRDPFGNCEHQETMGISFAVLFGIADEEKREKLLLSQHITPNGAPCLWPNFSRYQTPDGRHYGRHSGPVWPHIQGFWASAAACAGNQELFDRELKTQTENALRYNQFAELYHPDTGEVYGGLQESFSGIVEWKAQPCQTWSATAYLRNIYQDLLGMHFEEKGIRFAPVGSKLVSRAQLKCLHYRNAVLHVTLAGSGSTIAAFRCNGEEAAPFIPCDCQGEIEIQIELQ